jgi:hypothetical protein
VGFKLTLFRGFRVGSGQGSNFSVMLDRRSFLAWARGYYGAVGLTDEDCCYDGRLCEEFGSVREGGC